MTGGYVSLLRCRLDDPWLRDPTRPVHRAAAYWWLHAHAAWRSESRIVKETQWVLQRGQLLIGYSALAAEWKWNVPAVQRFLEKCTKKCWLRTDVVRGRMIITLLDYDAWRQVDTAGDMARDRESPVARDAGDTALNTGGMSRQPPKTAKNAKPFRNDGTAGDADLSTRYRNHDMHTDSVKEESSEEYNNGSSSGANAHANGRPHHHSRKMSDQRIDIVLKSATEQPMAARITAAFDAALERIFGPGQGTGRPEIHGNYETAQEMWHVAERAGLSESECCEIAQNLFREVLTGFSERAGPHDHTRGRILSLRFFHGDRSPRWVRAIDAHLIKGRSDKVGPARESIALSRSVPAASRSTSGRRRDPLAAFIAEIEDAAGVVIDASCEETVT